MTHNIVLAGVGGQGILTIARGLSAAALARGIHVKQAEVHGMSQRGGAVYSHLRISDQEVFSDLIPAGQADMILAVEPLEALRYVPMLKEEGVVVSSTNAVANITSYPPIEQVLSHIAGFPSHIAIDMERLARAAGSTLSANIVALGAASHYLGFTVDEMEQALTYLFESKGERVLETNLRAFRFGRTASAAYLEGLQRGATPQSIRQWIETLPTEALDSEQAPDLSEADWIEDDARLSAAEAHAFESILTNAYEEGRRQLYEHEVYSLIELVGAISPPRYVFVPKGAMVPKDILESFPGEKVAIKLVSPDVIHKTEAQAVAFVPKTMDAVRLEVDRLISRHSRSAHVEGVLVVEFVDQEYRGFGSELFVGIRATREFGPVIAAGLGGLYTEYLASKMLPGVAVAKALATDTDAESFLELFKETAAYDLLAGRVRGHSRVVSDGELLRCFRAFISIARRFCVDRGEEGPDIGELEVNPFAYRGQKLVPLDGRGTLRTAAKAAATRPRERIERLLEPRSIAIVGVSAKADSLGRIILENILKRGFAHESIRVVKPGVDQIEGIRCVSTLQDLEATDLLVVCAPASGVPGIIAEAAHSEKISAVILISGGAGEAVGSEAIGDEIQSAISSARSLPNGPVFLGPNCMGVRSANGRYDTFFIPDDKLPSQFEAPAEPVALISQSGAFIVSRLSALSHLNPIFSISLGNQADLTVSDMLWSLKDRADVQVAGVYVEGFANLDGLETARSISAWSQAGKTVVFYKGGRTETGRTAAAGHTMAVAGDYEICLTAIRQAGALVVEDFRTFAQTVEVGTILSRRKVSGGRLFAVTNAGMEAVGMADALPAQSGIGFLPPSEDLSNRLSELLAARGLGTLVSPRNPLDLTPMADESAYDAAVKSALVADEVDALVVSCVPLAPQLKTTSDHIRDHGAFAELAGRWLADSEKPIVFVVDSGREFDDLADAVRTRGLPVFRSADEATRVLSAWIEHRLSQRSDDSGSLIRG